MRVVALVKCPECQREISNQSQYCIHCGYPMLKELRDSQLFNALVKNDEKRVKNLMTRAKLELEDKEYTKAEELTEKVLELDPKLPEVYILKLFVLLQVADEKEMTASADRPLTEYKEYIRALRFAQGESRERIMEYNRKVLERFENDKNEKIYKKAKAAMDRAAMEEDYEGAAAKFESISQYKDALELSKEARRRSEAEKQQKVYLEAVEKMELAKNKEPSEEASLLQEAGVKFQSIENYKDAEERKKECEEKSLQLNRALTYQKGVEKKKTARQEQEFLEAAKLLYSIPGYKDADSLAMECENFGRSVGSDYLETLLRKRKRRKILKKAVITTIVVMILVIVILGGLTNFTYSLEEYHNLQQGQGAYFWEEAIDQIKNWFVYAGNIF